jgi:hypothetical protein
MVHLADLYRHVKACNRLAASYVFVCEVGYMVIHGYLRPQKERQVLKK